MELKEAYQLLDLPEDASEELIEKRYDLLLRKARNMARQQPGKEADEYLSQINQAYRTIRRTFEEKEEVDKPQKSPFVEKLEHFWEYYKLHTLGVILGIALIVVIVQTVIDKVQEANLPPPDMEVLMIGNFFHLEADPLKEELLAAFPEWENMRITLSPLSFDVNMGPDYALLQRAIVMLATERPHIFIVDKNTFDWMVPQQPFLPLDALKSDLISRIPEDKYVWARTEEDESDHVYGIDGSTYQLLSSIHVNQLEVIVAVAANKEWSASTELFFQRLIQSGE